MLDDFTAENGATAILPGSHKLLHHPHAPNAWYARRPLSQRYAFLVFDVLTCFSMCRRPDAELVTGTRGTLVLCHGECNDHSVIATIFGISSRCPLNCRSPLAL